MPDLDALREAAHDRSKPLHERNSSLAMYLNGLANAHAAGELVERKEVEPVGTAPIHDLVRRGLESIGATGLVCEDEPCGCGLDDLFPCGESDPACKAAYAVLCDGTNCESCEARPYPNRPDFETVCFTPIGVMAGGNDYE